MFAKLLILYAGVCITFQAKARSQVQTVLEYLPLAVGYAIIVTSVFNVLKGLSLLDPEIQWWHAYIVTAISSGIISAALEAITWTIVVKRKKASEEKQNQRTNGVNEANGHAARTVRLEPEVQFNV